MVGGEVYPDSSICKPSLVYNDSNKSMLHDVTLILCYFESHNEIYHIIRF